MKKALLSLIFLFSVTLTFGQYSVDFEGAGETKGAYGTGNVTLSGLDWTFTEALIGTLANDYKNGVRSARLRGRDGSVIEMINDKTTGLGNISFNYRTYGTDGTQQPWAVEYSTNSGGSWTQIGTDITATGTVQTFSENVNVTGNVRVRVRLTTSPGTTGNRRFNIDDIVLTDNTCTPATISGYTPTSGPIGTEITITASSGDLSGATATFGGVAATVVSSSASQMVIEVPSGATGTDIVITDSQPCDVTQTGFTFIDTNSAGCDFVASFTDLFISEVTDASSGSLTYVEIFNATGATVNMNNYLLRFSNNGTFDTDIALTGTLAHGDSFIFATSVGTGCAVPGGNGEYADQTDVHSGINNNDCISLRTSGGVLVDLWGVCDGSNWITAAGYGSEGYDFRRLSTATAPNTTFSLADWNVIDYDSCNDSYDNIQDYIGVNPTPIINTQPTVSLNPCDVSTTLSVTATEGTAGGQALAYQWYHHVPGNAGWTILGDAGVYSGTTTNTLSISNVVGLDGYQYYCQVRESVATCYQASEAVKLDVTLASVWNGATWSNAPDNTKYVYVNADYDTSVQGSFEACNLEIAAGATLNIRAGDYVLVENDIIVNGDMQVRHEGSFVQVNDAGTVTINGAGNIDVHKTSSTLDAWWAYTYWASPVTNETIGSVLGASNATYRFMFNPAGYSDISPLDGADDDGDDWIFTPDAMVMTPGVGYTAMGPDGAYPRTQSIVFNGEVNNGIINVPISTAGFPDNWNLVGNPYPSAIDIHDFKSTNNALVEGTIYLWNHESAPISANTGAYQYNFDNDDFAVYNVAMGTGTAANSGGAIPTRYVASGQSFFIRGLSAGTAIFNNAMRETGNNNGFFFTDTSNDTPTESNSFSGIASSFVVENDVVNNETTAESTVSDEMRDLLWFNMRNDDNAFNQLLLGFVDGASNGLDEFESEKQRSAAVSFYMLVEGTTQRIQGRQPLMNIEERVPLGINSKLEGQTYFEIEIDHFEGNNILDYGIYLEDSELNVLHDLRVSEYGFTVSEGVSDNRFALVFKKESLSTDDNDVVVDNDLILINNGDELNIFTRDRRTISAITIYDMLGKRVYNFDNLDTDDFRRNLPALLSNSIYVVNILFEDNTSVNKKFIRQ